MFWEACKFLGFLCTYEYNILTYHVHINLQQEYQSYLFVAHFVAHFKRLNFPVALHEYETWSPTFRAERRLRMSENRTLTN
jgi:hypothetical protein